MKMNKLIISILTILTSMTVAIAQRAIVSNGGNATGSGGSASYSVGQIDYVSAGLVSAGVQQPVVLIPLSVTGIANSENLSLELAIYPNPSSDFVVLKLGNYTSKLVKYNIMDIYGKILTTNTAENDAQIPIGNFSQGQYIISICTQKDQLIKSFKLIKN
jgi:hypothetical protein